MIIKLLQLVVSIFLLVLIYIKLVGLQDFSGLNFEVGYALLAFSLFIPITLIPAWRWTFVIRREHTMSLSEATRVILCSSSLNLILPSKGGDLLKGLMVPASSDVNRTELTGRSIYEKLLDLSSLTLWLWFGTGYFLFFKASKIDGLVWFSFVFASFFLVAFVLLHMRLSQRLTAYFKLRIPMKFLSKTFEILNCASVYAATLAHSEKRDFIVLFFSSILLWLLHLLQFYFAFLMLREPQDFLTVISGMPIAIYVGLLPITLGGIGLRDWAIIKLFQGGAEVPVLAAVGIFSTIRYLLPALIGLPFLYTYSSEVLDRFRHHEK